MTGAENVITMLREHDGVKEPQKERRRPTDMSLADLLAEALEVYEHGKISDDTPTPSSPAEGMPVDCCSLLDNFRGRCDRGFVKIAASSMRQPKEKQTAQVFGLISALVSEIGQSKDEFFVIEKEIEEPRVDGGGLAVTLVVPKDDSGRSSAVRLAGKSEGLWMPTATMIYTPGQVADVESKNQCTVSGWESWAVGGEIKNGPATIGQLALAYYCTAEVFNISAEAEEYAPQLMLSDVQRQHVLGSLGFRTNSEHTVNMEYLRENLIS